MGCCGGKSARNRPPKPAAARGTERVLVAYTGEREALFSRRGPATRTKYLASAKPTEQVIAVYVEDVAGLEAAGDWVRVEAEVG